MLSEKEALKKLKQFDPFLDPQRIIVYNGMYLILALRRNDPLEGDMDPYYSVDMNTGAIQDFSIFKDGKANEIVSLFVKAPKL